MKTGNPLEAKCMDCALPYENFGTDMVLPYGQWKAIHPAGDGLLCGTCICRRADKLKGTIVIHAVIEFAQPGNKRMKI